MKRRVTGGENNDLLNSAELYDPATGIWSVTGSLNLARVRFTATLLPSGKVLVAGGFTPLGIPTNTAELYDTATGTWSLTGNMNRVSIGEDLVPDRLSQPLPTQKLSFTAN